MASMKPEKPAGSAPKAPQCKPTPKPTPKKVEPKKTKNAAAKPAAPSKT